VRLYVPDDFTLGYNSSQEKQSRPGYRYPADNMVFVDASTEVAEGVHLVATTSPYTGYFSSYPPNEEEPKLYNLPELSLALETDAGIVLVVGCSHSGVEAIAREARRSTGTDPTLLTGGFHLMPFSAEHVSRLARSLKEDLHVRRVAPGEGQRPEESRRTLADVVERERVSNQSKHAAGCRL
jgi:7,8-dihydropterin-6-yl-methyl-4-(beta-D-ribofuranosyl)aminobenzene 5'-phosphate synthase